MYLNSSKLATVNNLMLNLNTFKSNTKLTILPTLCDTGKLDWLAANVQFSPKCNVTGDTLPFGLCCG